MSVSTFLQPKYSGAGAQTGTAYPLAIDDAIAVLKEEAAAFSAHESSPLAMTVTVDPGVVFKGIDQTRTEVGTQVSAVIMAPLVNPRIDRVVVDQDTGVVSVVAGAENVAPVPPAIPARKLPCCRVDLAVAQTEIVNADIVDEKYLKPLGMGDAAFRPMWSGAADPLTAVLSILNLRDGAGMTYAAGGTANALTITPVPAATAYVQNQRWVVRCTAANTASATLNVSGLGAKTLKLLGGSANLAGGELIVGLYVDVVYDSIGGVFQILSQSALPPGVVDFQEFLTSGTWTKPSNKSLILIHPVGGGGGGSSIAGGGTSIAGGGGGGARHEFINASDLSATETVTIGAGGAIATSGGNTSFGSFIAYGGFRGNNISGTDGGTGGGGGGQLSAGGLGPGGGPGGGIGSGADGMPGGGAGGVDVSGAAAPGGRSLYGGGGGAASNFAASNGGASLYGGGGGAAFGAGGVSVYGGNGSVNSAAATVPGGGGGALGTGADGWCRVWSF